MMKHSVDEPNRPDGCVYLSSDRTRLVFMLIVGLISDDLIVTPRFFAGIDMQHWISVDPYSSLPECPTMAILVFLLESMISDDG